MRSRLKRRDVVTVAAEIADAEGFDQLTLASVAKRLKIALPSLYTHVDSLDHLRQQIALLANDALAHELGEAIQGRSRLDAVSAFASAYRRYARKFPGRYAASHIPLDSTDGDAAAVLKRIVASVYGVLRGYDLHEPEASDAVRFLRAALHGFVALELAGAFKAQRSLDKSFHQLIQAIDRAFSSWPAVA
jgi:AcrR family transcriptional regulator